MRVSFPDRHGILLTLLCIGICLWCITCGLGCFTGHSRKIPLQSLSPVRHTYLFARPLSLSATIGFWAYNVLVHGL
ncbi:hypothetical protein EV363DRAFT_1325530, partial [Boletus edulis]